jgi:hypothetical protein
MLKLHVLTLVSMLLLTVVVGCSSPDQAAIDKAVSATLAAGQPETILPTARPSAPPVTSLADALRGDPDTGTELVDTPPESRYVGCDGLMELIPTIGTDGVASAQLMMLVVSGNAVICNQAIESIVGRPAPTTSAPTSTPSQSSSPSISSTALVAPTPTATPIPPLRVGGKAPSSVTLHSDLSAISEGTSAHPGETLVGAVQSNEWLILTYEDQQDEIRIERFDSNNELIETVFPEPRRTFRKWVYTGSVYVSRGSVIASTGRTLLKFDFQGDVNITPAGRVVIACTSGTCPNDGASVSAEFPIFSIGNRRGAGGYPNSLASSGFYSPGSSSDIETLYTVSLSTKGDSVFWERYTVTANSIHLDESSGPVPLPASVPKPGGTFAYDGNDLYYSHSDDHKAPCFGRLEIKVDITSVNGSVEAGDWESLGGQSTCSMKSLSASGGRVVSVSNGTANAWIGGSSEPTKLTADVAGCSSIWAVWDDNEIYCYIPGSISRYDLSGGLIETTSWGSLVEYVDRVGRIAWLTESEVGVSTIDGREIVKISRPVDIDRLTAFYVDEKGAVTFETNAGDVVFSEPGFDSLFPLDVDTPFRLQEHCNGIVVTRSDPKSSRSIIHQFASVEDAFDRSFTNDSKTYESAKNSEAHYVACIDEYALLWILPGGTYGEIFFVNYRLLEEKNNRYLVSDSAISMPSGSNDDMSASGDDIGDFLLIYIANAGYSIYQLN